MSNLTAAQSRALGGLSSGFLSGLRRTVEAAPARGEGAYMTFGKDGLWSFGAENNELNEEDRFLINIESLATGYVCWTDYSKEELVKKKKNEKLGARMLLISQGEVDYATLPDHGWDWRRQVGFRGRFMNQPYAGKVAVYETSSGGGDDAFIALTTAVMSRLQELVSQGSEEMSIYPIVKMINSSYIHKTYGKTYKPVFDIVDWATADGRVQGMEQEQAPVKTVAAPQEEVAEGADAASVGGPVQRRRRG